MSFGFCCLVALDNPPEGEFVCLTYLLMWGGPRVDLVYLTCDVRLDGGDAGSIVFASGRVTGSRFVVCFGVGDGNDVCAFRGLGVARAGLM